jgi:small-conductance mechanosensitive channel
LDFVNEHWFVWVVVIAVSVPLLMVVCTELVGHLERRDSPAVKPVKLIRNWVIPVGGTVAALIVAGFSPQQDTWLKVLVTVMGFLLLLLLLSVLNVAIFRTAKAGTWREKIPSIFVDIARVVLIVIGLAVLFSVVWNADVGGLFAALGVTSIVMGLALQNAVGGIISGLLLLFEQPFKIGDFLDTGAVRGKVIEVNWRAVHLDVGNGTQIVPNSQLAAASFLNLSRPQTSYRLGVQVYFSPTDSPDQVKALLRRTAETLPMLQHDKPIDMEYAGNGLYEVGLRVATPFTLQAARDTFRTWLWYASARAGLSYEYYTPDPAEQAEQLAAAITGIAPSLDLNEDACNMLLEEATLETYGPGETIQSSGEIPSAMRFVISGIVKDTVPVDGQEIPFDTVDEGDFIGLTAFTREPTFAASRSEGVTSVLTIPLSTIDKLVKYDKGIAKEVGAAIQRKREYVREEISKLRTRYDVPHY